MNWRLFFLASYLALASYEPAAAQTEEASAYVFRGVSPGVTTAQALRANERWGAPQKEEPNVDGSQRWVYQPQGYKQAIVTLRGGRVEAIDVFLPDGVSPSEAVEALKLGQPVAGAKVSALAKVGEPMPAEWEAVSYSAGQVLLYVDRRLNAARAICSYAKIAADAAPVGEPGAAGGGLAPASFEQPAAGTPLQGPDARSREIMAGLARMLPENHISGHPVDDEIAKRTLALFINQVDGSRLYLTRADVDAGNKDPDQFADQLRRGELSRFYDLYRTFLARLAEREAIAFKVLDSPTDFTLDESYDTSYYRDTWAENDLEIREAWRKRIKYELLVHLEAGATDEEAKSRVTRTFRTVFDRARRVDDGELLSMAASALCESYDPRTGYMTSREWGENLTGLSSQMVGIGASLQMVAGYPEVVKVIVGGPASKDGRLQEGDRIVAIAEADGPMNDLVGLTLSQAVDRIRGAEGSKIRVRAIPKSGFEAKIIELTRARFETLRIGSAVLKADAAGRTGDAKIGYVYLPTLYTDTVAKNAGRTDYRSTARDMQKILADLRTANVDVAVLDMRDNPGGTLSEAIELAGLFVGVGPIVTVRDSAGKTNTYEPQEKPTAWGRPLVVLVNKSTSGGSEIVAAAVQDYRRGIVIGDSATNGNGVVGSQTPLAQLLYGKPAAGSADKPERLGVLRFTAEKFYRATGDGFQSRGVTADIVLPSLSEVSAPTQASQPFALSFDTVAAAKFTPASAKPGETLLQSLSTASQQRREKADYFRQVAARAPQLADPNLRNSVSLNKDKFFAARRQAKSLDAGAAAVPGIPDAKLTPYLQEAFAVALDYAAQARSTTDRGGSRSTTSPARSGGTPPRRGR